MKKILFAIIISLFFASSVANAFLVTAEPLPAGSKCPAGTQVIKTDPKETGGKVTCGVSISSSDTTVEKTVISANKK